MPRDSTACFHRQDSRHGACRRSAAAALVTMYCSLSATNAADVVRLRATNASKTTRSRSGARIDISRSICAPRSSVAGMRRPLASAVGQARSSTPSIRRVSGWRIGTPAQHQALQRLGVVLGTEDNDRRQFLECCPDAVRPARVLGEHISLFNRYAGQLVQRRLIHPPIAPRCVRPGRRVRGSRGYRPVAGRIGRAQAWPLAAVSRPTRQPRHTGRRSGPSAPPPADCGSTSTEWSRVAPGEARRPPLARGEHAAELPGDAPPIVILPPRARRTSPVVVLQNTH